MLLQVYDYRASKLWCPLESTQSGESMGNSELSFIAKGTEGEDD